MVGEWLERPGDELEDGEAPAAPDVGGLRRALEVEALPWFESHKKELANRHLVPRQAFGEALGPGTLERLGRYEVHLDRKFERTLAMLLRRWGPCARQRWRAELRLAKQPGRTCSPSMLAREARIRNSRIWSLAGISFHNCPRIHAYFSPDQECDRTVGRNVVLAAESQNGAICSVYSGRISGVIVSDVMVIAENSASGRTQSAVSTFWV